MDDLTEAKRVESVRRDFVANVGHEIKTPVGALQLLAEAALDAHDDPEAVQRFVGRMQHEAQRLSRLVQELLDLSRLQGGEPLPSATEVSVDAIVDEAVDRARLVAEAKGIRVVRGGDARPCRPRRRAAARHRGRPTCSTTRSSTARSGTRVAS